MIQVLIITADNAVKQILMSLFSRNEKYHVMYVNTVHDAEHIINKYTSQMWSLIYEIKLNAHKFKRLYDGIHWLSEATKPDTNNAKFIKISIALETMLGKEVKDEELKVRGITAMLAERTAFITGRDCGDKLDIDKNIRNYYGKRGAIVHGEGKEISLDDIDGFGNLVRRVACSIIEEENR